MSWFKRTTKGIRTSTQDKKIRRRVSGINPLLEKLLTLKSWLKIFMFRQKTAITFELEVRFTSTFFLMKASLEK